MIYFHETTLIFLQKDIITQNNQPPNRCHMEKMPEGKEASREQSTGQLLHDRICWYDEQGHLHRDRDNPACVTPNVVVYMKHGLYHRENDRPAEITRDELVWWCDSIMKRGSENDPVIVRRNGRNTLANGKDVVDPEYSLSCFEKYPFGET
jgi:hypothetical protein